MESWPSTDVQCSEGPVYDQTMSKLVQKPKHMDLGMTNDTEAAPDIRGLPFNN